MLSTRVSAWLRFVAVAALMRKSRSSLFAAISLGVLSMSAVAAQLVPADTANAIKVIGHYKQYNVYDVDASDLELDLGPFPINGTVFQTAIEVADAMTPVDVQDTVQGNANGIRCEFLCVSPKGQIVGYNPIVYAKVKGTASPFMPAAKQVVDAPSASVPRPVDQWHGYKVYQFASNSSMGTDGVIISGSTYFSQLSELTAFLPAISEASKPEGVTCYSFLCIVASKPGKSVIGYSAEGYAAYVNEHRWYTPNDLATHYRVRAEAAERQRKTDAEFAKGDAEAAVRQSQAAAAVAAAYKPPRTSNPGTSSGVPADVIRQAITSANPGGYDLTTWIETNAYVQQVNGEAVHYIEYQGAWYIKREMMQYVGSKGGISFRSAIASNKGRIGLVKRGNSWYIVKG